MLGAAVGTLFWGSNCRSSFRVELREAMQLLEFVPAGQTGVGMTTERPARRVHSGHVPSAPRQARPEGPDG